MKQACLLVVLTLLAGWPLHGQGLPYVTDMVGGSSFAPGSLAELDVMGFVLPPIVVSVNGINAYTFYEGNSKFLIQIPVNAPAGTDLLAAPGGNIYITLNQYAPLLMPQGGNASAVSAWHSDGSLVSAAAPAMPNEMVHMDAVGLGPTNPQIATGATGYGLTTTLPTLTLGGNKCSVLHAVLGNSSVGDYQVYFTVPANTPSGNQNVSLSIGGATSNTLTLAVGPIPAITGVLNNYSYVLPSAANYGIAPGSIFVIFGSGMAAPGSTAVLQDSSKGLPLTLNGASVAVTVAGITESAALYYATPTQIAAVLPSLTPLGTATVTVTYDGMTSATATAQVVQSALGFATMSGDGTGQAMATDANYNLISPTNSAAAGQIITLWGSGLGADIAVSDTTYTAPHQITNIPLTVYLGGIQAQVVWAGRSGYPGLDQINVQVPLPYYSSGSLIPSAVPFGCADQMLALSGINGVASNTLTLPVAIAGGACMQPSFVLDPSVAQAFSGQATVNIGSLAVLQDGVQAMAGGSLDTIPAAALAAYTGSEPASAGSCIAVPPPGTYTNAGLYAGNTITVTGPAGQQILSGDYVQQHITGDYGAALPAKWIPASGGSFTFAGAGNDFFGSAFIGAFTTTVNEPAPLEWTNQSSIGSINRSQGAQLTWTGGDADGVVAIRGSSFAAAGAQTRSASFMCSVPASAGEFTIPASILQSLPAGAGTLTVENQSATQPISSSGLDIGHAYAGAVFTINALYN